jgi:hypothetical protein
MAPRVSQTTQVATFAGLLATHTAPTVDGDVVDIANGTFLSVINGGGGSINVTVVTPGLIDGDLAVADRVVAVPVGTTPKLIPLNSVNYRQSAVPADSGRAYVDYSAIASVTRAVIQVR